MLQSVDLRERVIHLRAKLKAWVRDRSGDADVSLSKFCSANEIPEEWLCNVVESKRVEHFFPNDAVDVGWWSYDTHLHLLRVPVNFGMTR